LIIFSNISWQNFCSQNLTKYFAALTHEVGPQA
jgi:hypothetical protein